MLTRTLLMLFCAAHLHGALNPSEKEFGDKLEAHKKEHPSKPFAERTIEELRDGTKAFLQYAGNHAAVVYRDLKINDVTVRVYNEHLPKDSPVLIFYPGCGFIFDLFEVNSIICSRVAANVDVKVFLVQFRLAPEHPMPISIYDGYEAAAHIAAHFNDFGIDPDKIILGGWCSGAHCAASVSNLARQGNVLKVYHQVLLGGCYDLTETTRDFDAYEQQDKLLYREFIRLIVSKFYGITQSDYTDPILSPYHEKNFDGYPPTTLLVGEYDGLRNDTEGYFLKLQQEGVSVNKIVLPGQTHNTVSMRKVLTDGEDPAATIARVIQGVIN